MKYIPLFAFFLSISTASCANDWSSSLFKRAGALSDDYVLSCIYANADLTTPPNEVEKNRLKGLSDQAFNEEFERLNKKVFPCGMDRTSCTRCLCITCHELGPMLCSLSGVFLASKLALPLLKLAVSNAAHMNSGLGSHIVPTTLSAPDKDTELFFNFIGLYLCTAGLGGALYYTRKTRIHFVRFRDAAQVLVERERAQAPRAQTMYSDSNHED